MNLSTSHIRSLLSPIYGDACLKDDIDMKSLAGLLEYLADRFENTNPHTAWHRVDIDKGQFDQPAYRNYLVRLKKEYYLRLADVTETKIHNLFNENPAKAWTEWKKEYVNALVDGGMIVYSRLCSAPFKFDEEIQHKVNRYRRLNAYIFDNRWDAVYPLYCELAEDDEQPEEIRSKFAVYAGEIQLHHLLPDNETALRHFREAKNLYEGIHTEQAFGEYYLKLSNYEKAREYFMTALSMDPADVSNYLFVGDTYRDQLQYKTARQWYNDALRMNFLEPTVYERLVLLHARNGFDENKKAEMEQLVRCAEEVEISHPDYNGFNDLYRNIADAYYITGDLHLAARYYEKAIYQYPHLVQAYIDLGYIRTYKKQYSAAIATFNEAAELGDPLFDVYWGLAFTYQQMENYDRAVECYEKCLELLPSRSETIEDNLAYFYRKTGNYSAAKRIYKKLIAEHTDKPEYVNKLIELLTESNDIEELEKLLNDLIKKEPDNYLHHNNLGNFYFDQGQFEKAVSRYKKAIDFNDQDPVVWENLGLARENINQTKKAEDAYLKAADLDQETGLYFNRLGVFYNTIGEHAKSVPYYQKALEREPGTVLYKNNLGIGYSWLGELEKAEQVFNDVLSHQSDNTVALTELASVLIKLNHYEEAKPHLEKLTELEPQTLDHLGNLGFIYQQQGDYSSALGIYNRALEIDPESDFYYNQAGVMHYWLGNLKEAKADYNLAIQNNPDSQLYYSNLELVLRDLGETEAAEEAWIKSEELARQNKQASKR